MRTVVSFALREPVPASQYLRQVAPLRSLETRGRIRLLDGAGMSGTELAALPADTVIVLQRDFTNRLNLLELPFPIIYDLDDNLLDLPADHPDAAHYAPLSAALRANIGRFAAVTVSTDHLRGELEKSHPRVVTLPNRLPGLPGPQPRAARPRILLSGTRSHLRDVEFLTPVIARLAATLPVEFVFWGYFPPNLSPTPNLGLVEGFESHYPRYLDTLASIGAHIGLVPLPDRPFNRCKSDLKLREYAACGMAVLASDTLPYRGIRHGIDGMLLPDDPRAWETALLDLLGNPSQCLLMAENARQRLIVDEPFKPVADRLGELIDSLDTAPGPVRVHTPRVSVVIPVFNHCELTRNCLQSIVAHTRTDDFQVVVVDNGSTDDTPSLLAGLGGDVKVVVNRENLGFARACNQGARTADGRFLLFLNNDTQVRPGWLETLLEHMETHPETGIAGARLLYEDDTVQHAGAAMRHDRGFFRHPYKFLPAAHPLVNRERDCDAVTAACFITPKELFLKLGGFDEGYLNGCEDMDYCTAVREAGYAIRYLPGAAVTHLESRTPRPKPSDAENFARYLAKWGPDRMRNEIEFYAEDGFWSEEHGLFEPAPNRWYEEFRDRIEQARQHGDTREQERWTEVLARIYPVERWQGSTRKPATTTSGKLRILFVCHDFPPYRWAGAQLYARYLARELNALGHEVHIFHPVGVSDRKPGEPTDLYRVVDTVWEDLRIHQVNINDRETDPARHPQHCFSNPEVERAFAALLERERFDLVHYHLLYRLSGGLPTVTRRMGIPSVATLHDYWLMCATGHLIDTLSRDCSGPESPEKCARCATGFTGDPGDWVVDFYRRRLPFLQEALRNIDRVFAPSAFLADAHARFGFARPEVLPLGWLPVQGVTRRPRDGVVVFGFAGQTILRKGLDLLVQALADIPETNWKLLVWGRSNRHPYFEELLPVIEAHPRMEYRGGFAPEDLPGVYSQIDVAVIPSRRENYPLTLLESLSAGIPVVVSNVGGVPEMIRDRREGFIFPNGDLDALRSILRSILQRPEILDAFRANLGSVRSIADDAPTNAELYRNLIAERKRHA